MIEERVGGHGTSTVLAGSVYTVGDVSMTDTGFGLDRSPTTGSTDSSTYARYFSWDEENRLVRSVDNNIAVQYSYGADGQRAVKYSKRGESLYFDSMWSCQTDVPSMRQLKNIFVGQTRIATRLSLQGESSTGYEKVNTYYYHPDHLGSAQLVTDYEGDIYERIEYTPYGETWIERTSDGLDLIPFRFTGKELDSETGLYYYGARYLNPKSSMWLSADPALGDYIPVAPVSDEARKHNQNLAGMGGVFNLVNLAVYHYAANNPVKYTDPDGRIDYNFVIQHEGGQLLNGYVPQQNGVAIGNSGVTIASGFDIGQHNSYDLNRIFGRGAENQDLKTAYTPYLLLTGQAAIDAIDTNGLTISQDQADRTDTAVMQSMVGGLRNSYHGTTGASFDSLPDDAQTALFDLYYNSGNVPSNIMMLVLQGKYSDAAAAIEALAPNASDPLHSRRVDEANLLRQVPDRPQLPPGGHITE